MITWQPKHRHIVNPHKHSLQHTLVAALKLVAVGFEMAAALHWDGDIAFVYAGGLVGPTISANLLSKLKSGEIAGATSLLGSLKPW